MTAGDPLDAFARQQRSYRTLQPRQIVHIIIDRRETARVGIQQHLIEPSFGLAGEDRNAEIERFLNIGRNFRQHGEAARDMKTADTDPDTGGSQRPGHIHGVRELVRLNADEADHAATAIGLNLSNDFLRLNTGVGFIGGPDDDIDVGSEKPPVDGIGEQPVERRQRVRRYGRAKLLDDIAVIVVMRRLDQIDQKRLPPNRA